MVTVDFVVFCILGIDCDPRVCWSIRKKEYKIFKMTHSPGIYSKTTKHNWLNTAPIFNEKEILIHSYQVMQRWEDNYMKSLAAVATSQGGKILEVGFGMGISAGYIEKSKKIQSHVVIECHPAILANAKKMFKKRIAGGGMKILKGFWEQVAPTLPANSFDGILFDSCPLDSGVEFFQFFPFFKEAFRLLKDNGFFTYFSDEARSISPRHMRELRKAGFKNIQYKLCKVNPPKTCEYWKHKTIVVPIVRKT